MGYSLSVIRYSLNEMCVSLFVSVCEWLRTQLTINGSRIAANVERVPKTWHNRRVWSFTPFVVVVGSKYFLPAPVCLLFDRANINSRLQISDGNF